MQQIQRCHTISVVIPVLNEESTIGACVANIRCAPHVIEVIVVDGMSRDKTVLAAQKAGAVVIVHDRHYSCGGGRGGQIKAGIEQSAGDVVAVVHADTTLSPRIFRKMIGVLNSRPSVIGGAVGCRFRTVSEQNCNASLQFKLRIIEFLNDARAVFFNISFGDQIQFFRRKPVVCHNLFPDMPLMEDVEFSIKLNSLGKQVFLFGRAVVSARRWERLGSKNSALIIWLFIKYIIKRLFTSRQSYKILDTVSFYEKYYKLKL